LELRFLGHHRDAKYINEYIENANKFFNNLPPVCPYCGWIGEDPLHHGYNDNWICPIRWLALNIRHLHAAKTIEFSE
jgi:hypothetical protein